MSVSSFISSLKSLLPVSSLPWVLPALRHDILIWESLSGDFGEQVLQRRSDNPDDYSPAGLALIALDLQITPASLRLTPMQPALDDPIGSLEMGEDNQPLVEAGLLALQLRQFRRLTGSWDQFPGDISHITPTSLACLYGMIPEPEELLASVLTLDPRITSGKQSVELILSILLSNPLTDEVLINSLYSLPDLIGEADRLKLLRLLSRLRPQAAALLSPNKFIRNPIEIDNQVSSIDKTLIYLSRQVRETEAYEFTENHIESLASLDESIIASRRLGAQLAAKSAWFADQTGDMEATISAWERACELDPQSPTHLAHLALTLIDVGRTADAQARLTTNTLAIDHPLLTVAKARLFMHRNDIEAARDEIIQSLQVYLGDPEIIESAHRTDLIRLIRTLLELHLPYQATRANELGLSQWPNDPDLLGLLRDTQTAALELDSAIDTANLIVALLPEQVDQRRKLAENLELINQWDQALEQRRAIFEISDSPEFEDFRSLAYCSLKAGYPEKAINICQQSLLLNDEDGEIYAILGQAQATLGEDENALDNLHRATHLTPDQAAPWLALAQFHADLGRGHKAKEVLQSAILAAPELAELHLVLGQSFIEEAALTQALSAFRRASDLISGQPYAGADKPSLISSLLLRHKISLYLGNTLRELGHLEEARKVLNDAYLRTPTNTDIASILASTLIDLDKRRLAITPLETVLNSNPDDPTPYLEYARCLLTLSGEYKTKAQGERLIPTLQRVLQLAPGHLEATVLLAEAYTAEGEYLVAMDTYQDVMEANMEQGPEWQSRLILGLGNVALKLGQIETAVASLKEANQIDPSNPQVKRWLSEAYEAAGLTEDAFLAASSAIELSPNDVEILTWFADQVVILQGQRGVTLPKAHTEVLDALERATLLAPQRSDLWLKLGKAYLSVGNEDAALNTFKYLADIDAPKSSDILTDLFQAAEHLLLLEDHQGAASCLEHALEFSEKSNYDTSTKPLDLLILLSKTRYLLGDYQAALGLLDRAIEIDPDESGLYLKKIDLILEIEQSLNSDENLKVDASEALICVEKALALNPDDINLLHRAAQIYRANGNLDKALNVAQRLIAITKEKPIGVASARLMAADLALAMLHPEVAYKSIDYRQSIPEDIEPESMVGINDHRCLRAELALNAGDDHIAIEEIAIVMENEPDHPWIHALQSRLANRRNDRQTALDRLHSAVDGLEEVLDHTTLTLRGTIEAAIEIGQWDIAIQLSDRLIEIAPFEPLSYLLLARALTNSAEFMRLCQALDIVKGAPHESALSYDTYQRFEGAIETVNNKMSAWADKLPTQFDKNSYLHHPNSAASVERWRARGHATFQPDRHYADALAKYSTNPADVAARVACLRQIGDLSGAGYAARQFPRHPLVLIQLALALEEEKPRQAMAAVHAAADVLAHMGDEGHYSYEHQSIEVEPIIHALLARLFLNSGHRAGDRDNALQAIQIALAYWPDEPRWHILAAEIYLRQDDSGTLAHIIEPVISHLEQAINLEPEYTPPYMTLGKIYFEAGYLEKAIQILEQAIQLSPDQSEPWLLLAHAHYNSGDLISAETCAERAVILLPNQVEPLLLRGQIALDADNPRAAQSRAQAALRIDPENPIAMLLMAKSLRALDRYEESLAILEIALPLAEDPIPFWLEKVRLINQTRDQGITLDVIQQLNEKYPDEPRVLALMAEILDKAQQCEQAIQTAQRALRVQAGSDPLSPGEQANLHYLLGSLFRCSGQLDQAVFHLNEAVRLAPSMVEAYLELGLTHQERREHNQALDVYQRAIEAVPNDYRAYFQVGVALKESKDYLGAEKMLRRAAELTTDDPGIHRLLAAVVALNLVHSHREFSGDSRVNV
jgi:tetratricopeptide (TPR) repeat protein